MTSFLSRLHKELRGALHTKRGATHRPNDVPRFIHKAYPRMPQLLLPEPQTNHWKLEDVLRKRSSMTTRGTLSPLSLSEVGSLLGLALRSRENGTRNYPSGGGLYPIETYVISVAIESQAPGVFHYNPTTHALERLLDLPSRFDVKSLSLVPKGLEVSTLIVFTSVWKRSSAKYGDFTYTPALLEAGHMSENILLVGTTLDLLMRPHVGFHDDLIAELLDLDIEEEQPVHSVLIAKRE